MADSKKNDKQYWEGIGRRKRTSARVRIYLNKKDIVINDKPFEEVFPSEFEREYIVKPLVVAKLSGKAGFSVVINGGGITGWKDAIRLGLARALVKYDENLRKDLRAEDLLTRDDRVVERKKPGLKKARKKPRFSKR